VKSLSRGSVPIRVHLVKRFLPLLSAFVALARALAQVEVQVSLPQEIFLVGEPIEAALRIANFTGSKAIFGKEPGWLRFNVEAHDGFVVNRLGDGPDPGEFSLESSTRGTVRLDIQPSFDLARPGRYRVSATIRGPGGSEFTSPETNLEVVRGAKLWDKDFGILAPGSETPISRKYLLSQVAHLREARLYIRVTDADESGNIRTVPLGSTVSFNRPACSLDRQSRLHVLHQFDVSSYRYHQIGPDGTLLARRTYVFAEKRPQLRISEAGEVAVVGGDRRRMPNDVPTEDPKKPTGTGHAPLPAAGAKDAPKPDAPIKTPTAPAP